jgi:hypothetical protein
VEYAAYFGVDQRPAKGDDQPKRNGNKGGKGTSSIARTAYPQTRLEVIQPDIFRRRDQIHLKANQAAIPAG